MRKCVLIGAAGLMVGASAAQAVVVGVGPSTDPWNTWMNVFVNPLNGGGEWGSPWGQGDAGQYFDDGASTTTLFGTYINSNGTEGDDMYWYGEWPAGPGSTGRNTMESNFYYESTGVYTGVELTFEGTVLSNTLVPGYEATAWIKDFAPDYSGFILTEVVLGTGPFSVTWNTINDPARHVQYGFSVTGLNMWLDDRASKGNVVIATPAPASIALLGLSGLAATRRRR